MKWINRLDKTIRYMEKHLTEEIDYEQLTQIACCLPYHFQRMFAYMAEVPLSEYIRRRRMSLATVDLQDKEAKTIDIVMKYGYTSPTALNRASQSAHGTTPSLIRKRGAETKSFPPINFTIAIKGVEEMNYRIEQREAFCIVEVSQPLYSEVGENFGIVLQIWQKTATDGTVQYLASMMDNEPKGILGVSVCGCTDEWRYWIAAASTQAAGDTLEEYIVPSFTWAIFSGVGQHPQAIQELEQRTMTEWLPTLGYEYDNGPDIEVYFSPDPQNAQYKVWIPVVKR